MAHFSGRKNKWRLDSCLPEGVRASSAVILDNTMYNIGGYGSSHSIHKCDQGSTHNWVALDIPGYGVTGMKYIFSFALNNQIISFVSHHSRDAFVFEKEKHSEELALVRKD